MPHPVRSTASRQALSNQAPSGRSATGAGAVRIIGGRYKRSKLTVASAPGLRPTPDRVRETLFNWLGQDVSGWRCLDMFAGSGALGLEAASRGATLVDLVERDARVARKLEAMRDRLGADMVRVHVGDALRFSAGQPKGAYDLVFIDPPYATADDGLHPRALEQAHRLLRAGGLAYLEAPDAGRLAAWCDAPGWTALRTARAGAVHYALLRRDVRPEETG